MYSEDQLLPISALQHLVFCERQCALIHVERIWVENRLTVEGRQLHQRAHAGGDERRQNVTTARTIPLRSLELGLYGVADVVELHFHDATAANAFHESFRWPRSGGKSLPLSAGLIRVLPIEYKRGRPKKNDSDRVQLCAQALCLEDMLGFKIASGTIFYGMRNRRTDVELDVSLRCRTQLAIERVHQMIDDRETPRARRESKCDSCSLVELCLPHGTTPQTSAMRHFQNRIDLALSTDGPTTDTECDVF